jgi:hypothetical protein
LKLPVTGFNPDVDELKIYGDFFNYNVIIDGESYVKNITLDNKFNKVDEYAEKWETKYQRNEGKIFGAIFPFELSLKSDNSRYIDFRIKYSENFYWILLSLLFVGAEIYWIKRMKNGIMDHLADLLIIAVTGIFGFIAVNIFQNKFFK